MLKIKKKFASNVVKSAIIKNSIKQILIRGRAIKKRFWGPCKVGCSLISFRGIYIAIDTSQSMESLNLSGLYLCTCSYNKWLHKSARIVNILEMSSRCVCKYSDSHVDTCIMPKLCMLLVSVDTSSAKTLDVFCICWEVYVLTSTKTLDVSNAKTRDVYQWQKPCLVLTNFSELVLWTDALKLIIRWPQIWRIN